MEGIKEFESKLATAVDSRRNELDSLQLPKLREDLHLMLTALETISQAFTKKSIFRISSIRYYMSTDDIDPPSMASVPETKEKIYTIGTRFGQYMTMLEHVVQRYQFSCVFLSPQRIAKLNALLDSFNWNSLTITSGNPNTRAFAEIIQDFKKCGDAFSITVVTDSITRISETLPSVLKTLKMLSLFHRESYKLDIRINVLPRANIPEGGVPEKLAIEAIKRAFSKTMGGSPFYTDLIKEILAENNGEDAASRRQNVLARLETAEQGKAKKKQEEQEDCRAWLNSAIRELASASQQFVLIVEKLRENLSLYKDSKATLFSRLNAFCRRALSLPAKEVEITISISDPASQRRRLETIQFNSFLERLEKKARILSACGVNNSSVHKKFSQMSDQKLFDALSSTIANLNAILRKCAGIDEFFKTAVNNEVKAKIRGIKIEISTIENTIHKANRLRTDYAARIEEKEQLKKLGIS